MLFVLILIITLIGYYFYYEKIVRPRLDIERKKRDEEHLKISLIRDRHPIMKEKFTKFAEGQKYRINIEGSFYGNPTEMGNEIKIFGKRITIFSYDDVRNFEFDILRTFKQLESDVDQKKMVDSIVQDYRDFWKKEEALSNIERNNFNLLYLKHKHLLTRIFPERRINRTNRENYITKTKEEIVEELVILEGISKEEAIGIFQELTSLNFGKRLLRTEKEKYYLDDEKTLLEY